MRNFRVGLIGTGRISEVYLRNCAAFGELEIVACGSLNMDESHAKAAEFGVPRVALPEEIIADPEIDSILNLTIPAAHANVSIAALESGKHVYSEKPFVTDLMDGRRILDLAREKGLTVSNAPDTFLGGRWQTVRKLLDSGVIGAPTGVAAFVPTRGVERHHPNPDFYYAKGGGPLRIGSLLLDGDGISLGSDPTGRGHGQEDLRRSDDRERTAQWPGDAGRGRHPLP